MIESKPGIKTLLPFLKNITEESHLQNLIFKMSQWPQTLSIDFNKFIAIRKRSKVRFQPILGSDFLLLRRCLVAVFTSIFLSQSERELQFISRAAQMKKKRPLAVFDGLYYRAWQREEQGEKSCIVSHNNFIFIEKRILFCKQYLFVMLMCK